MLEYVADVRLVMMAMERGQKHVDGVKQKASKTKIKVQTDVVLGSISVAKAILHYAEQHNIDLIVIGARGMSVIKGMLLAGVLLWCSNLLTLLCSGSKINIPLGT